MTNMELIGGSIAFAIEDNMSDIYVSDSSIKKIISNYLNICYYYRQNFRRGFNLSTPEKMACMAYTLSKYPISDNKYENAILILSTVFKMIDMLGGKVCSDLIIRELDPPRTEVIHHEEKCNLLEYYKKEYKDIEKSFTKFIFNWDDEININQLQSYVNYFNERVKEAKTFYPKTQVNNNKLRKKNKRKVKNKGGNKYE